jgi:hypothetical protein
MVMCEFQSEASRAAHRTCWGGRGERGAVLTEMVVAMAILAVVVLPMAYAFMHEMKLCRSYYYDAVAMEIVDGEMEILAAGEWRAFPPGVHPYPVRAGAATNLPPGRFVLTVAEQTLRLEWRPAQKGKGRPMVREARVK